jgi:hypothetical protein
MNCYICEKTSKPMTLRYDIATAIGVCHDCGIGVCAEHSRKARELGAPLLCQDCAMRRETLTMPIMKVSQKQTRP